MGCIYFKYTCKMFLKSVEAGLDFCLVLSSNIDNANANLIKNVFWSKCQKSGFFCFVLVHSSQVPSYSVNIKFEFNTYFYEIVKSWILLTTFKKGNITYVWQDSQYTSGNSYHLKSKRMSANSLLTGVHAKQINGLVYLGWGPSSWKR